MASEYEQFTAGGAEKSAPANEPGPAPKPDLSPAAQRALAEAAERRAKAAATPEMPEEFNGREGPDPVRFGDWEKSGIASDF